MIRVVHGPIGEEGPIRNGKEHLVGSAGEGEVLFKAKGVPEDVGTGQTWCRTEYRGA